MAKMSEIAEKKCALFGLKVAYLERKKKQVVKIWIINKENFVLIC